MTDNDFRAAVDVQIVRWQFQQIVEHEFEQPASSWVGSEREAFPPGSASRSLLAPRDTASTDQGRGGSETGDQ